MDQMNGSVTPVRRKGALYRRKELHTFPLPAGPMTSWAYFISRWLYLVGRFVAVTACR